LAPIVLLVPLVLAVTGALWEGVARREAETLVAQRQATALDGLTAQLRERRQSNQTIVYLISKRDGLGSLLSAGDTFHLAQTLVLMQATLDLGYINVYSANGQRLFHLGGSGTEGVDGQLVTAALQGRDASAVGSAESGLVVAAAAAVSGTAGTAAVLVVGTPVAANMLRNLPSNQDVAVFQDGRLIDTSLTRPDLLVALNVPIATVADVDGLNAALAASHVRAAGTSLAAGNVLLALVPTEDLDWSSQLRTRVVIGGALALVLVLMLAGLLQARAIARPLENLVVVAGALVRGEYRRVGPSLNYEVDALGRAVNHLADQLEHKLAELTFQATHDALSGLPNRKLFLKRVEEALVHGSGAGVAVLFLDLDRFKIVNDSLGHASGDQLIVAVTERLRACFVDVAPGRRPTIARLGGDEFTILLVDTHDDFSPRHVAERVVRALAAPFQIGLHELVVSASVGIARSTAELARAEDLLRAADVAMYRAKGMGGGKWVMYESAMGRHAAERLDQETELRQAIEGGALCVYYQPIVDLATGRLLEVEAHPRRGLIMPADFIPLAEETGLIVPLGRFVLKEACPQLRVWHQEQRAQPPLVLNVNLSARELAQPNLAEDVRQILAAAGIPPATLTLEITESFLMHDSDAAQLRSLGALGVNLAIDDFGTGYSSLAYLSRLPIDTLKIDRSFVARLGQETESVAVVQTIIALAHALRLSVTAEGIEHAEQASQLRALGCTRAQGYYFAQPQPAAQVDFGVARLAERRAA
jgi:diguanylate cyclase (GGDEF)-like protein